MATISSEQALDILRTSVPGSLQLDAEARANLDRLLIAGAERLSTEPNRLDEALSNLQSLWDEVDQRAGLAPLSAFDFSRSLKGLCPLFPIC